MEGRKKRERGWERKGKRKGGREERKEGKKGGREERKGGREEQSPIVSP